MLLSLAEFFPSTPFKFAIGDSVALVKPVYYYRRGASQQGQFTARYGGKFMRHRRLWTAACLRIIQEGS
jgi:hypothetical protein